MRFYKPRTLRNGTRVHDELDAQSAVAYAVDTSINRDGELERISERADRCAEMPGRLLQELIDNGTLRTAEQVERILSTSYVQVED